MFKTFRFGGIHPDSCKEYSKESPIERLPMPKMLTVPMSMSAGAPAKLVVGVGDVVSKGQLIGEKSGFVSANVHSPADGVVKEIVTVTLPAGNSCSAARIETNEEQSDPFSKRLDDESVAKLSKQELVAIVERSGIVGMGGAAFPANVKYSVKDGVKVEYLLINACECEPYLTCDCRLLVERRAEIIKGIRVLKSLFGNPDTRLCTEANKKAEAEGLMVEADSSSFALEILKTKYPQGDEKSIINAVTGREVPSGKLPLDVGCVVVNLGTAVAVYEAVYYGKPSYERVVTVTGKGVRHPKNLLCPVGAPVRSLLDFCGGLAEGASMIISGGPMMGFSFYDLDTPIAKATSGILVLDKVSEKKEYPCISCGRCAAACPMRLVPTRMYKFIMNERVSDAIDINLMDCRECGCCEFSCPSGIPLVQGFKMGKKIWRSRK